MKTNFKMWIVLLLGAVASTVPSAHAENFQASGTNTFCVTCNVGIATSTPTARLDIRGGDIVLGRDEAATRGLFQTFSTTHSAANVPSGLTIGIGDGWTSGMYIKNFRDGAANSQTVEFVTHWGGVNAGTRLFIDKVGLVGIGTTGPAARLHTYEGNALGNAVNNNRLLERISGSTGNTVMRSLWMVRTAAGSDWNTAKLHDAVSVDGAFQIPGTDTRTWWERNPVAQTQSWGTGGTTFMTLSASGDLTVTGNLAAKYQDLAEWVPAQERIPAATVVIVDPARANTVLASNGAYDTRVAGVISARPGIALGERGEGKVLVATTGRVKVRADARKGPIRIGDLLVTSDQPGAAMRSEPLIVSGVPMHRPGTLIGKALESLEKGEGEILVLLSLQ